MNVTGKSLLIFSALAGFAGGVFFGYTVANKKLETEYEEALKKDLESRENYVVEHLKRKLGENIEEDAPGELEVPSEDGFVDHLTRKYKRGFEKDENPYLKYAAEREHPEEEESNAPYVIMPDDFTDSQLHYDKLSYTYCRGDGTLLDENEEIAQVDGTIGTEVLKYILEELQDGPMTVYVRNDKLGVDYEVVFIDSSYSRDFLGIGGTDE